MTTASPAQTPGPTPDPTPVAWYDVVFVSGGDGYRVAAADRFDAMDRAQAARLATIGIPTPPLENVTVAVVRLVQPGESTAAEVLPRTARRVR